MKGKKEVRVDVMKGKSITGRITGRRDRKERRQERKEQQRKQHGKVSNQGDAKQKSYSEAVIEGALRTETVFMGSSILRNKTFKHSKQKKLTKHYGRRY